MTWLIAVLSAIPDLIIKYQVEQLPADALPRSLAGGHLAIDRFHNHGFSLSRGEKYPERVTACVSGIFALFLGLALLKKDEKGGKIPWETALVLGGGFSNLFDRLRLGYVVDYLQLPRTPFRRLIFNLGDLCLLAGCLIRAVRELIDR